MNLTAITKSLDLLSRITALDGGAAGALDAIPTADVLEVGTSCVAVVAGEAYFYQLQAGTTAESSPAVIRPDDYAGGTNEKVWVRLTIAV